MVSQTLKPTLNYKISKTRLRRAGSSINAKADFHFHCYLNMYKSLIIVFATAHQIFCKSADFLMFHMLNYKMCYQRHEFFKYKYVKSKKPVQYEEQPNINELSNLEKITLMTIKDHL